MADAIRWPEVQSPSISSIRYTFFCPSLDTDLKLPCWIRALRPCYLKCDQSTPSISRSESFLKMQNLGPHLRSSEAEPAFSQIARMTDTHTKSVTHGSRYTNDGSGCALDSGLRLGTKSSSASVLPYLCKA